MSERGAARLAGWIRFVPDGDGYGLPLFSILGDQGSNYLCTPRTDELLRITSFDPFYNSDGYSISHHLPSPADNKVYNVYDAVPIPFILDGQFDIIHGDINFIDLNERFSNYEEHSVGGLIRTLIIDARQNAVRSIFINRLKEFNLLLELWESVEQNPGHARFVVLMGDAGIGKTALLHHFASTLHDRGLRTPQIFSIELPSIEATKLDLTQWNRRFGDLNRPVIVHVDDVGWPRGARWLSDNAIRLLQDVWGLVVFETREHSLKFLPSVIGKHSVHVIELYPLDREDKLTFLRDLRISSGVEPDLIVDIEKYIARVDFRPGVLKRSMENILKRRAE